MRYCYENLPDEIFFGLNKLEKLDLTVHRNLFLPANVFKDLRSLKSLHLSSCGNTTFCEDAFSGLVNLSYLDLSHNNFKELKTKVFNGLSSLKTLNVINCKIVSIEDGFFSNFP